AVNRRSDWPGMQHRPPLDEARGRCINRQLFLQFNLLPRAPVAVGIVHVAAAREEIEDAASPNLDASPLGKILGVEDIALVPALGDRVRTQQKDFPQIAGGG